MLSPNQNQNSKHHPNCSDWVQKFHAFQAEFEKLSAEANGKLADVEASGQMAAVEVSGRLATTEASGQLAAAEASWQMAATEAASTSNKVKYTSLIPIADKLYAFNETLEEFVDELNYGNLPPEVLALKEALEKDHQAEIAKWQWYPKTRLEADGTITNLGPILQKDPETGRYFYTGDYDGTAEAGGKGENFTGENFIMPTLAEAMKMMTPDQAKLYKEMEAAGELPKLQLVPIALEIRTLGRAIDSKRDDIQINRHDTYVSDYIKDSELKYEPESFKASSDGNKLITTGGISKSEYIRKYQGWAVEIISMKTALTANKPGTNAQKTEAFMKEALINGFRGCTFESAAAAYMAALMENPPIKLDDMTQDSVTITADSNLTDQDYISVAFWANNRRVYLNGNRANFVNDRFRFRRLVRFKK